MRICRTVFRHSLSVSAFSVCDRRFRCHRRSRGHLRLRRLPLRRLRRLFLRPPSSSSSSSSSEPSPGSSSSERPLTPRPGNAQRDGRSPTGQSAWPSVPEVSFGAFRKTGVGRAGLPADEAIYRAATIRRRGKPCFFHAGQSPPAVAGGSGHTAVAVSFFVAAGLCVSSAPSGASAAVRAGSVTAISARII